MKLLYVRIQLPQKKRIHTIDNIECLKNELRNVKSQGYAIDNEEREIGLYCIGAPILDKSGNVIASINMSGPTARMKNDDLHKKQLV